MNKIKQQLLILVKNSYFPFVVLTFLLLFFHACIQVGKGDDAFFQTILRENDMFEWLAGRYNTWSSRLIIEFFLVILSGHHFLWRLLNIAVTLIGAFSITKIFSSKKSSAINWLICALILCLPEHLYHSAGWIATALNYSWVIFLGLFTMIPIKKIMINEKIAWYEYILYFCAMIYAVNQEQMCLILLIVFFSFMCYRFYSIKKLNWFLLAGFLISLSSLVFILTCPGNANRNISETKTWFPDYVNISLFRKSEMGYSSTLFEFIMNPNLIFLIFSVLLFTCVVLKQKNNIVYKFIAFVPLSCNLIFGFLDKYFSVSGIKNSLTQYGTGVTLQPITWLPDIVVSLVCICVVISLFAIFERNMFILTTFIMSLGFISRIIICFSPTIWASSSRTFMIMYISIMICSLILYQEIRKCKVEFHIQFSNYIVSFSIIISWLTNMSCQK